MILISDKEPRRMDRQPHIYGPLCRWEPNGNSVWYCAPTEPGAGCRTRWNTFWTAGCCPGCGHFWAKTQCLSCKQHSPHEAWYHYPPDEDRAREGHREREESAT
jgi:hypothetical protein